MSPDLSELSDELRSAMAAVDFLLLDVDGVLTDGRLYFDAQGRESKVFHVHDGSGLVYWKKSGFRSGLLSGRDSVAVRKRAEELGVDEVQLGRLEKKAVFEDICRRHELEPRRVCYVGDDLLDLPVLRACGVPISVPQGRPEVKAVCHYITRANAGQGAVREVVEILLKAKGMFQSIVDASGGSILGGN